MQNLVLFICIFMSVSAYTSPTNRTQRGYSSLFAQDISSHGGLRYLQRNKKYAALYKAIIDYEKFHKDSLDKESFESSYNKSPSSLSDITNRYLLYTIQGTGMANTMLAIMSAYVLALLTNRVLLIDIGGMELQDLFCEPFSGSSWAVPKHMLSKPGFQISAKNIPYASDVRQNETTIIKIARVLTSFAEETYSPFPLTCGDDLVEKWKHIEILHVMKGSNYFITLLFMNPRYASVMRTLFPENKVSEVIAKYLLSPIDEMWIGVKKSFYNKKLDRLGEGAHSYFGIQNRVFNLVHFDNNTADTIIGCMTDLSSTARMTVHLTSMDARVATHIQRHFNQSPRHIEVRHNPPEISRADGNGNHRVGVDTKSQAWSNIRDILVLSLNDKVVVTRGSTMGYMATALSDPSKTKVYFINTFPSHSIRQYQHSFPTHEKCTKMSSVEPCMHFKRAWGNWKSWFCDIYVFNDAPIKKNVMITHPDVILCEDFTLGVKIDTRWNYNGSDTFLRSI